MASTRPAASTLELQNASKTAAGAAAAGAGTQAGLATEATGRQLLGQAIATGQQLPGQAINASQAGVAAQQGAENATLANANTGVALTDTGPASLISAAPNLSPNSQSSGQNVSQSQSTSQNIPQPPVVPSGTMQQAGANQLEQLGNYSGGYSGGGGGGGSEGVSVSGPQSGQYARGGTIPGGFSFAAGGDATQGGYVPQSASPSGGVNVDDVPANLNAEEFVIPRDVARWKGEEFWHKEIAKSRAARAKAAATVGPTAGPPQAPGQQPTFTSQSFRGGSQQRFAAGGTTETNQSGSWGGANAANAVAGTAAPTSNYNSTTLSTPGSGGPFNTNSSGGSYKTPAEQISPYANANTLIAGTPAANALEQQFLNSGASPYSNFGGATAAGGKGYTWRKGGSISRRMYGGGGI